MQILTSGNWLSTSIIISEMQSMPREPGRVADGDGVEPAAAARAAGGGAVLAAEVANALADVVVQLGGKRPAADARAVGLGDADHLVDPAAGHAGAAGDADARSVAAGDVRKRAVVDVEQRALGALRTAASCPLRPRRADSASYRRRSGFSRSA